MAALAGVFFLGGYRVLASSRAGDALRRAFADGVVVGSSPKIIACIGMAAPGQLARASLIPVAFMRVPQA
jgi:hypothetical protein